MSDIREQVARTIRENSAAVHGDFRMYDANSLADVLLNSFVIRPRYSLHADCQALNRYQVQCQMYAQETIQGIGLCRAHAKLKEAGRPVPLAVGEWS
jgi:hypothetical protein